MESWSLRVSCKVSEAHLKGYTTVNVNYLPLSLSNSTIAICLSRYKVTPFTGPPPCFFSYSKNIWIWSSSATSGTFLTKILFVGCICLSELKNTRGLSAPGSLTRVCFKLLFYRYQLETDHAPDDRWCGYCFEHHLNKLKRGPILVMLSTKYQSSRSVVSLYKSM